MFSLLWQRCVFMTSHYFSWVAYSWIHWKTRVVMIPDLSSLVVPQVVISTTYKKLASWWLSDFNVCHNDRGVIRHRPDAFQHQADAGPLLGCYGMLREVFLRIPRIPHTITPCFICRIQSRTVSTDYRYWHVINVHTGSDTSLTYISDETHILSDVTSLLRDAIRRDAPGSPSVPSARMRQLGAEWPPLIRCASHWNIFQSLQRKIDINCDDCGILKSYALYIVMWYYLPINYPLTMVIKDVNIRLCIEMKLD